MLRVKNNHGGRCCGVDPGAEGEVDPENRGVKSALEAKLLVPVETERPSAEGDPGELGALRARFDRWADDADRRIVGLTRERDDLVVANEALTAERDQLRADLEALTAPKSPTETPKSGDAPPPATPDAVEGLPSEKSTRTTRKG